MIPEFEDGTEGIIQASVYALSKEQPTHDPSWASNGITFDMPEEDEN